MVHVCRALGTHFPGSNLCGDAVSHSDTLRHNQRGIMLGSTNRCLNAIFFFITCLSPLYLGEGQYGGWYTTYLSRCAICYSSMFRTLNWPPPCWSHQMALVIGIHIGSHLGCVDQVSVMTTREGCFQVDDWFEVSPFFRHVRDFIQWTYTSCPMRQSRNTHRNQIRAQRATRVRHMLYPHNPVRFSWLHASWCNQSSGHDPYTVYQSWSRSISYVSYSMFKLQARLVH